MFWPIGASPFATWNRYRPSWSGEFRLWETSASVPPSVRCPDWNEPGSRNERPEPFVYATSAGVPPKPFRPPLASPVSHCMLS